MLVSVLRKLRREGKDNVAHKEAITEGDMKLLKTSGVFMKNNPLGLLQGVWFYVTIHWCRRRVEGLRNLRLDSFTLKKDDSGRQYFTMTHQQLSKNHQGGLTKDETHETEVKM